MMVRYAQDSGKINFFREIFAIMTSLRVFGFKNRNFAGFSSGIEILKPFFDCGGQGCRIISAKVNVGRRKPWKPSLTRQRSLAGKRPGR
jgi:hypothetical protein